MAGEDWEDRASEGVSMGSDGLGGAAAGTVEAGAAGEGAVRRDRRKAKQKQVRARGSKRNNQQGLVDSAVLGVRSRGGAAAAKVSRQSKQTKNELQQQKLEKQAEVGQEERKHKQVRSRGSKRDEQQALLD